MDRFTQHLRGGRVVKTTSQTVYFATTLGPEEAGAERLLALVRQYWAIESRQHYRRDRTQGEDHCQVRHFAAARVLSLMRSVSIFLHERQKGAKGGKKSLPDWQSRNHRDPNPLLRLLVTATV